MKLKGIIIYLLVIAAMAAAIFVGGYFLERYYDTHGEPVYEEVASGDEQR